MNIRRIFPIFLVVAALLLQACGPETQIIINTAIAQTQQISELETAAAAAGGGGGQAQPAATDTPQPGETGQPTQTSTITPTFTPSIPYVSVSQDTNCRSGPASSYGYVTTVTGGQQMQVLKVYNGTDYVIVQNPNGSGECWLWLRYADNTDFSAYNLPIATQPPTPTPTYTPTPDFEWSGDWQISAPGMHLGPTNFHVSGSNITGSFMNGANTISFSLTIDSSRQKASGTWTSSTTAANGTVQWMIKSGNHSQFIGSYGDIATGTTSEWCGARLGSSFPSPCQWP